MTDLSQTENDFSNYTDTEKDKLKKQSESVDEEKSYLPNDFFKQMQKRAEEIEKKMKNNKQK